LIVDLDVLNIGELFKVLHDRARDGVERSVGLTRACEIDMCHAIGIFNLAIAGEAVQYKSEPLIPFHANRSLEVFIEHGTNDITGGGNEACGGDFVWKLTADQFVIVGKVNIDLHIQRRACGSGSEGGTRRTARREGWRDGERPRRGGRT